MIKFNIEFWNSSTREKLEETHERLVKLGMSREEAKDLLENLYHAISAEYGG